LLHGWVTEAGITVDDWGATDAARPAEFVELLLDVGQAALTTGLGVLITEYVKAHFQRKKAPASKPGEHVAALEPDEAAVPLRAVTIVNESGGTIVVMNSPSRADTDRLLAQAGNRRWSAREVVA